MGRFDSSEACTDDSEPAIIISLKRLVWHGRLQDPRKNSILFTPLHWNLTLSMLVQQPIVNTGTKFEAGYLHSNNQQRQIFWVPTRGIPTVNAMFQMPWQLGPLSPVANWLLWDGSTFADKTLQNQSVELINDAMASLCEDLIDFGTSKSLSRSEGSSLWHMF